MLPAQRSQCHSSAWSTPSDTLTARLPSGMLAKRGPYVPVTPSRTHSAARVDSSPPAPTRANNAFAKPAGVGCPHPKRFHTPCSSCLSAQRWLTTTSQTGTMPAPLSALFSATSCSLVPYLLVRLYSWPGRYDQPQSGVHA